MSESRAESTNKGELIKGNLGLIKHFKRRLSHHDRFYEEKNYIRSLYILSMNQILSAIMYERKETTNNEDYWIVIREIFNKKEDLKLLHIIDRFSLTENFWLTLGFTRVINELFKFLQKQDLVAFKELQAYFLVYTV